MASLKRREYPNFVTHLECSLTGEKYEAGIPQGLSKAGRPLLVRYDLDKMASAITKEAIEAREGGFWRYREFLPVTKSCLLYTSPSPRDATLSRMPSSA